MRVITIEDVRHMLPNKGAIETIRKWLARGDGCAVYQNQAMDSGEYGRRKFVSYGSERAQLEMDEPPERLPDIGGDINWAYQLIGVIPPTPLD